jgi:hypothetical protein
MEVDQNQSERDLPRDQQHDHDDRDDAEQDIEKPYLTPLPPSM